MGDSGSGKESFRILKKNGVLRVVMPDLDILIKNYSDPDVFNNEYLGYEKRDLKHLRKRFWKSLFALISGCLMKKVLGRY